MGKRGLSREAHITTRITSSARAITEELHDALDAIKLCERLWPGETVTRLRKLIEADRKARLQ